ncbi:DUF1672 domain-containing protein [Bacillus aquiflavi]|uniref:DUF1672 family protein n=1 Tax=Bacillus aquiflavi TaxID=2672567 RepID=UPI001CA92438|nr:DUF1672 family protein [Bacillus aquiflavi]UAC48162.1 DUF1672 domain-containing protein [Bacillus aquiflavi]
MKHKKKILTFSVGMSLLLGGCFNMDNTNHKTNKAKNEQTKETPEEKYAREHYVPVQEYTGQGYTLRNGEKTDKIAKAHRDEIDKAVKKFFLDNYKTEVIVHNVVGAVDGASVFVESVGEPHFYTYAIVPIDIDEEKKC